MHAEHIPIPDYERLVSQFNPTRFDAEAWVRLMEEAEMRALLITSKHHDGFCMYDTSLSEYKVNRTPFKRDPLAELAEACHRHGIGLHFYYSLLDWHHPAYRTDWQAYVGYYQGQIRELCTHYGKIGGIVFDGYWPSHQYTPEDEYFMPGGDWDLAGTYDLIHSLQPEAMIANNHHILPLKGEDYQVWELDLPGENTAGFNTTQVGELPKATWFNVNTGWSYNPGNSKVKAVEQLISYLTQSAERGATCWLNVGPAPSGEIVAAEAGALRGLGAWVRDHREAIPGAP